MHNRVSQAGRAALALVALLVGVAGVLLLALGVLDHVKELTAPKPQPADIADLQSTAPAAGPSVPPALEAVRSLGSEGVEEAPPPPLKPITHLLLPRSGIDTSVVPAPYAQITEDEGTWEVPPFVAGHAEFTAGAGQPGNAVLSALYLDRCARLLANPPGDDWDGAERFTSK